MRRALVVPGRTVNAGILAGLSAYLLWGLFPLYFRLLHRVPALELVAHRVVWSALLLGIATVGFGRVRVFAGRVSDRRILSLHLATGGLIGVNWLVYVWGVGAGRVVECSLGYFLNPLVSIALGVVFLGERLRPAQWAGVTLAAAGVVLLAVRAGVVPWLPLVLAFSFGLYGLLKKRASLGSFDGLLVETSWLFVPALVWVFWSERSGQGVMASATALEWTLVVGTGVVTTVPLVLFGMAARRLPLSMVGLMQYLTPTMQLLVGVFLFHEPFGTDRTWGFSLVWAGLVVIALEAWMPGRRVRSGRT